MNSRTHGREAPPPGGFTRIARLLLVATPFLFALSAPPTLEAQKGSEQNRGAGVRIEASSAIANVCPGPESSSARVRLRAAGVGAGCKARYTWGVTGGRIVGEGPEVVWDFTGTQVDFSGERPSRNFYDVTLTVEGGPGCDVRRAVSAPARVVVWGCPPRLEPEPPASRRAGAAFRCPNIALCCHAAVRRGLLGPFTATLGEAGGVTPSFNWKLSAGQVAEGQGTKEILIDTKGLKAGPLIATVEVGGYGPRCSATCLAEVPDVRGEPAPQYATLNVSVKNALDGRPVPGALVKVYRADGAIGGQAETDDRGRFMRGGWTPGAYRVEVSARRFEGLWMNVTLDAYSAGSVALSLLPVAAPTATPTPTPTPSPTATPAPEPTVEMTPPPRKGDQVVDTFKVSPLTWLVLGVLALLATAGWLLAPRLSGGAAADAGEAAAPAEASPVAAAAATTRADEVHCTAYAPPSAQPDDSFLVQVFAHLQAQAGELDALACGPDPTARRYDSKKLSETIERGRELFLTLQMPGLEIDEPTQSIVWDGEVQCVAYGVTVPADFKPKTILSKVVVAVVNADGARVPVGHLKFMFRVAAAAAPQAAPPAQTHAPAAEQDYVKHKRAFISYASENRPEVAKRVQMLRAEGIECFMDVMALKPGVQWESSLYHFIDESDIFYLFWSEAAKNSPWVVREVVYALCEKRGRQEAPPEIMPIPIEGPPIVPPPQYLDDLHFNDPMLYLITAEEAARRAPAQV
ncbi:MAG TPA: TIR domain-containing protein [Pyrinomonadaceae bacterium]|nr:TIR domain-containing protein [Pyrinomonadaceae bacterium]